MHYHVIFLNESSTGDDMKKAYHKLDLQYHPEKYNHPQASADFCMINEAKQGLEDVWRHNDEMRRTKEI